MKTKFKKLYHFSNTWTGTIIIVLFVIFFIAQAFVIPSGSMKNTLLIGDHLFVKKFSYGVPVPHLPWLEIPVLPDFKGNGHLLDADGPKREDIVVFRYPKDHKIHYVKRCVAVGGDEIIYTEKAFFLHLNEGDEYIKKHYPKEKIHTLNGKLWVKNPYMEKYPGIHYDKNENLFEQMALYLMTNKLAMQAAFVEELPKQNPQLNFNAYYIKVPRNEYFMMGDNRDHSNDSRFWGSVPYSLIVGKPWFIYFSWNSGENEPNDKNKYRIRWERIGRFISTIQSDKNFINGK
ncbi:MAG: signal peptidase I [Proteobacteria bacterium]|nr:MAG: signal peptidase I [Pseudomonadota bacterium]